MSREAGIDDEPAITLSDDVSFSDFGLIDPAEIESEEALRDHQRQVQLLLLQEVARISKRQRRQGKHQTGQNNDITDVEDEIEEIKQTQRNCVFSGISSWISLTAKGGGFVAGAASAGYVFTRLAEYFIIGG